MSSRDLFAGGDSIRLSACSASDCMLLDLLSSKCAFARNGKSMAYNRSCLGDERGWMI